MPKFHVYQTSIEGPLKVVDTTHLPSANAVDRKIADIEKTEIGAVNWFGASLKADTPEKAVAEAQNAGFHYRNPGEMLGLGEASASFGAAAKLAETQRNQRSR